jgi:tetratricopeptide (TPR) repeat protein
MPSIKDGTALRRQTSLFALAILPTLLLAWAAETRAQQPRPPSFLATHYEISASLDSVGQAINATARVTFLAQEASRNVEVELHPNLNVAGVKGEDGKAVPFERNRENPLLLRATLPVTVAVGGKVTLTYTYSGVLANEENSPVPGVRVASITREYAYLLLPARWFPLTGFPSSRYTANFRLEVPDSYAVAGTGKAETPTPLGNHGGAAGGRLLYVFHCDKPGPVGTFIAGKLQYQPQQAEGVDVTVYSQPSFVSSSKAMAADVGRAVNTFSDLFGPIDEPRMTIIQLADGTLRSFAAPGVLVLSQRAWDPKSGERTIAGLVAAQWWGNRVLPATAADAWISDGLARYSEALYAEQSAGREAGLRAVDDFAVGALMYEDASPISQAQTLAPGSSEYRSVVQNKGAMVFHMLRAQMGDEPFKELLREFYAKYSGKTARIEDFETLAIAKAAALADAQRAKAAAAPPAAKPSATPEKPAPNLRPFFAQWLNSTGVPEFTIDFIVYRTPRGFRVVGKLKQPIDTFSMPVEVRIETEGNPETKTIPVVGTETQFAVETFGRPKPGGIKIDPNNIIMKGSVPLRARAAIARGEELAELGRYFDAIAQYQKALTIQPNRPLANFRMGEAFFYQKNYQAAANSFRESIQGVPELSEKWTEVWSHIYLGKIFDLMGQRERAVNEYSKAKQTNDDTGGAQAEIEKLLRKAYSEGGASDAAPATGAKPATPAVPPPADGKPVLKKRDDPAPAPPKP